jgi:hypothetical protein
LVGVQEWLRVGLGLYGDVVCARVGRTMSGLGVASPNDMRNSRKEITFRKWLLGSSWFPCKVMTRELRLDVGRCRRRWLRSRQSQKVVPYFLEL